MADADTKTPTKPPPSLGARVFRTTVLAMAATILVFLGVGMLLDERWDVTSERVVPATPAAVRPFIVDFRTWDRWAGMTVELGAGVERQVDGEPGTVGHSVEWRGAQGTAVVRIAKLAEGRLDYEYLTKRAGEGDLEAVATGWIEWAAEGDGTRVKWYDGGAWPTLVHRWIGWFGVLQESVRRMQDVSLEGLAREAALEEDPAENPGKAADPGKD